LSAATVTDFAPAAELDFDLGFAPRAERRADFLADFRFALAMTPSPRSIAAQAYRQGKRERKGDVAL
jgi:hypothetical protein